MANDLEPPPLDTVLAYGDQQSLSPDQKAQAVMKWRNYTRDYYEKQVAPDDPKKWFDGNLQVDNLANDALSKLGAATGVSSSPDYHPLTDAGGKQVGSYQFQQGSKGNADILVNIPNPKGDGMATSIIKVPYVTDADVEKARTTAQSALDANSDEFQNRDSASVLGSALGFDPAGTQRKLDTDAANLGARVDSLGSDSAKGMLQSEIIDKAFRDSPAGKKFEEWHPGEDIARGFAHVETGLNYAMQSAVGSPEAQKNAREAVGLVDTAAPGTTISGWKGSLARGAGEGLGSLPLVLNPAGVAVLGASAYGGTVATAMNSADAADSTAASLKDRNPDLAQKFTDLAKDMRDNAKTHGALAGGTIATLGRLMPEATTVLGASARGAAEWGGIAGSQDVLNQKYTGAESDPMAVLGNVIAGAAIGPLGLIGKDPAAASNSQAYQAAHQYGWRQQPNGTWTRATASGSQQYTGSGAPPVPPGQSAGTPPGSTTGGPPPVDNSWTGATNTPDPNAPGGTPPPGPQAQTNAPPPPGAPGGRNTGPQPNAAPPPGSQGGTNAGQGGTNRQQSSQSSAPPPGPKAAPPPPKGPPAKQFNTQAEFNVFMDNAVKSGDVEQGQEAVKINADAWVKKWIRQNLKASDEHSQFIQSIWDNRTNAEHVNYWQQANARNATSQAAPGNAPGGGTGGGSRNSGAAQAASSAPPEPAAPVEPAPAQKPPETPPEAPPAAQPPTPAPPAEAPNAPAAVQTAATPVETAEQVGHGESQAEWLRQSEEHWAGQGGGAEPAQVPPAEPRPPFPPVPRAFPQPPDAAPPEPASTTHIDPAHTPVVDFPVTKLKLSEDVPNFKRGADEDTGVVTGNELQGKYERRGTAPVVAWQRLNGDTEIITGRHRLDLAKRNGEKTIPTQIVKESDGFTKDQALTFDAEANIRDGQGEVSDYAHYFKNTPITQADAEARGLLSRAKGKAGWDLAKNASDDLYALYQNGRINEAQAVAIASTAPGDAAAQRIGTKFALAGKSSDFVTNVIKASFAGASAAGATMDLFGNDDSAMKAMEAQAERAGKVQKEIADQIRAVQGAAKRPDLARKLGVNVKDPKGIAKRIEALRGEQQRWNNWPLHPDLVEQTKDPLTLETQTDAQIAAEAERAKLAAKQAAPLTGSAGEIGTPDMLDTTAGDAPLFSQPSAKPKKLTPKNTFEALQKHFTPGAIVPSYGGQDRVIDFKGTDAGNWRVNVRAVDRNGKDIPGERVRSHMTSPDKKALEKALNTPAPVPNTPVDPAVIREALKLGHPVVASDMDAAGIELPHGYQIGSDNIARPGNDWTGATDGSTTDIGEPPPPDQPGLVFGAFGAFPEPRLRRMMPLDKATAAWSAKHQRSFQDARRAIKSITDVAKTEQQRAAIAVYVEAGGDMGKLGRWATAAPTPGILAAGGKPYAKALAAYRKAAQDAMSLTPEQIAIAQKVRDTFDVLHARGVRAGIINAFRDNYIPHVWELEKGPGGGGSRRLKKQFRFAKARTYDTIFDGIMDGMMPKTLDIAKTLPAYMHEMNSVIADRQFVHDVSTSFAEDGRPLVIAHGNIQTLIGTHDDRTYLVSPRGSAGDPKDIHGNDFDARDYKVMENQPALEKWMWKGKDADGNPIFMNSELAVHPDLYRRITAMMGRSRIRQWYNSPSASHASTVPKFLVKAFDKTQGVMKREMFSFYAPFHQVQEGTHGIGHGVNPLFNLMDIDLRLPGPADAARHGLMIQPDKSSMQHYLQGVGSNETWISKALKEAHIPGFNKTHALAWLGHGAEAYQDYLFHSYIPRLKYTTYEHILARARKDFASMVAAGRATDEDLKFLSAHYANSAFGHQNYAMLDRSPTIQHFLQLGFLSPDFTEARIRFAGQALQGLNPHNPVGREQFRAVALLAAVMAGMAYVGAKTLGGEWDWKEPFTVKIGNRKYSMRSVPEDVLKFFTDTKNQLPTWLGGNSRKTGNDFVTARVNPTVQSIYQGISGINWRGEKVKPSDTLAETVGRFIPMTLRQLPGVRDLTDSSHTSPVPPLQQLAGAFGLKISRFSPITRGYELANQWKAKNGIASDYSGTYPVSQYQQLRYAIEDGDIDRAATEYSKLAAKMKPAAISKGFHLSVMHSFTGSKANDAKFRASLQGEDKADYDAAIERRHMILKTLPSVISKANQSKK